ncbi:MAG: Ig-like domain-containing protein, partial [Spirochaetales bacterium]|nr:Ig-like domain-containing protein [Spirochaetales bacterium]
VEDLRQSFILTFSEPVNTMSFREALGLSPSFPYGLQWNSDESEVQIHPLENLTAGKDLELSVSAGLSDKAGNEMVSDFSSTWSVSEPLNLVLEELRVQSSAEVLTAGTDRQFSIEKDDTLQALFNRKVLADERSALIEAEPPVPFIITWSSDFLSCSLSFDEPLRYGEVVDLLILDKKYRLVCDGAGSIPLQIGDIRFTPDTETEPFSILELNTSLSAIDSETACLDVQLLHSPLSVIDKTSFIDAFNITSTVLDFEYTRLDVISVPFSGESCLQIGMRIHDTGFPGTARISIDENLCDSLSNGLSENFAMTVNQP